MTGNGTDRRSPPSVRIEPGTVSDIGRVNFLIARIAGLGLGTAAPNIFTTLARNRSLFRRWLRFAGGLMPGGRLPRADTELMILRTAHNCASDYEWRAHEDLARNAGSPRPGATDPRRARRTRAVQATASACASDRRASCPPGPL
jgi:alkylhydroperoxidase family enzyme